MSTTNTPVSYRYKLIFFTPPASLPAVKAAIFATGAGAYPGPGDYTQCSFTTPGIAHFKPGASANPTIGTPGELEEVREDKCEILCIGRDVVAKAVEALIAAHPYEEAAYEVFKLEDF